MSQILKMSPNVNWGAGPQAPRSGIDVRKQKDGIIIGGWYDGMLGIEGVYVSWSELQSWIPRKYRTMKVTHVCSK